MAAVIAPSVRAYASPAGPAPGRFETVHFPGSVATFAAGVDRHGLVVGYYFNQDGVRHGFTLQHGTYSALPEDPMPAMQETRAWTKERCHIRPWR